MSKHRWAALLLVLVLADLAVACRLWAGRPDAVEPPNELFGHAAVGEPVGPTAAKIDRLIKMLGSESFAEREAASEALRGAAERALPALLEAAGSEDLEVRRRASVLVTAALSSLARKHGVRPAPLWPGRFPPMDENLAVRAGSDRVVAILREGSDTQHLFLLDGQRGVLDRLSCRIDSFLTKWSEHPGTFRTEVADKPEADGARLVLRYLPGKDGRISGKYVHQVTHQGKWRTFGWDQGLPENIRSAEWEKKGLCRVAVRGDKFVVLFPDEADVRRRLVEALGGELAFWKKEGPTLPAGWWNGVGLTWGEVEDFRGRYRVTLEAVRRVRSGECRQAVTEIRDFWRSLPQLRDVGPMGPECDRVLAGLKQ